MSRGAGWWEGGSGLRRWRSAEPLTRVGVQVSRGDPLFACCGAEEPWERGCPRAMGTRRGVSVPGLSLLQGRCAWPSPSRSHGSPSRESLTRSSAASWRPPTHGPSSSSLMKTISGVEGLAWLGGETGRRECTSGHPHRARLVLCACCRPGRGMWDANGRSWALQQELITPATCVCVCNVEQIVPA